MTQTLEVMTNFCSIFVDDIRLKQLAVNNPALYARKMWQYFYPSVSLFTIPQEMQEFLVGTVENPKLTEAKYGTYSQLNETEQTSAFTVPCGAEYVGYEICSVILQTTDNVGNIVETNIDDISSYNSTTGEVVISATEENPIPENVIINIDFYTDGYFTEDLPLRVKTILGKCFNVVWQTRFINDWLSNVAKVGDASFTEQNRANKENADTTRFIALKADLTQEMIAYEQTLMYTSTMALAGYGGLKIK